MDMTVLETLVVVSIGVAPAILASVIERKHPTTRSQLCPTVRTASLFAYSVAVISVLLYIALNQPSRLMSIGIRWSPFTDANTGILNEVIAIVLIGPVMYGLVMLPFALVSMFAHKILKREVHPEYEDRTKAYFSIYRTPRERLILLLALLPAAMAEELVFRGYLVVLLGEKTGALALCVAISAILFAASHLHFGRASMPVYLWIALGLTWLTLPPQDLVLAISAHWSANVIAALKTWNHMSRYPGLYAHDDNSRSSEQELPLVGINSAHNEQSSQTCRENNG